MTNGLIVAINPTSCCPYQEKVASSFQSHYAESLVTKILKDECYALIESYILAVWQFLVWYILSQCFFVHKTV